MFNYLKRSALGAAVPHAKATAAKSTVQLPCPQRVVIPMQQHIGAPAELCAKKGDAVYVGSVIGKAQGVVSADVHSSVSGVVDEITVIKYVNGNEVAAVAIAADGFQTFDPSITPPIVENFDSFIAAIRSCGLVGLGGAGFPTAVKLSPKNLDQVHTLIINGAECEPFITADNREFMENSSTIISGILAVKQYLNLKKVVIGIERNKPEAIDLMFSLCKSDPTITVKPLQSRYPQGAEKVLIYKTTGIEVPRGKLPADAGVIVLNVSTVSAIGKFLATGIPLVAKRLTVDGDAIKTPKNVMVPIGTSLEDVIKYCGGTTKEAAKIITGGPMMGLSIPDTKMPVLKQNNAILVFGEDKAKLPQPINCIRCGRCIAACPMGLSPVEIANAYESKDKAALSKMMVDLCMSCGTCSFVCPSKRYVSQTIGLAKKLEKSGGAV